MNENRSTSGKVGIHSCGLQRQLIQRLTEGVCLSTILRFTIMSCVGDEEGAKRHSSNTNHNILLMRGYPISIFNQTANDRSQGIVKSPVGSGDPTGAIAVYWYSIRPAGQQADLCLARSSTKRISTPATCMRAIFHTKVRLTWNWLFACRKHRFFNSMHVSFNRAFIVMEA